MPCGQATPRSAAGKRRPVVGLSHAAQDMRCDVAAVAVAVVNRAALLAENVAVDGARQSPAADEVSRRLRHIPRLVDIGSENSPVRAGGAHPYSVDGTARRARFSGNLDLSADQLVNLRVWAISILMFLVWRIV
jgi:hypothetical protein